MEVHRGPNLDDSSTILYYIILYYTILYYTILYYTILYYTILYYTILYYTILYYTILYYTILYYTILYYTILYYTILYYTILWRSVSEHSRDFLDGSPENAMGRAAVEPDGWEAVYAFLHALVVVAPFTPACSSIISLWGNVET